MKCGKYNVSYVWLMIDKKKKSEGISVRMFLYAVCMYVYVERQQERGVLKHVRKTRNHQLIFRLISRYF